jgi:hypothetical protein
MTPAPAGGSSPTSGPRPAPAPAWHNCGSSPLLERVARVRAAAWREARSGERRPRWPAAGCGLAGHARAGAAPAGLERRRLPACAGVCDAPMRAVGRAPRHARRPCVPGGAPCRAPHGAPRPARARRRAAPPRHLASTARSPWRRRSGAWSPPRLRCAARAARPPGGGQGGGQSLGSGGLGARMRAPVLRCRPIQSPTPLSPARKRAPARQPTPRVAMAQWDAAGAGAIGNVRPKHGRCRHGAALVPRQPRPAAPGPGLPRRAAPPTPHAPRPRPLSRCCRRPRPSASSRGSRRSRSRRCAPAARSGLAAGRPRRGCTGARAALGPPRRAAPRRAAPRPQRPCPALLRPSALAPPLAPPHAVRQRRVPRAARPARAAEPAGAPQRGGALRRVCGRGAGVPRPGRHAGARAARC